MVNNGVPMCACLCIHDVCVCFIAGKVPATTTTSQVLHAIVVGVANGAIII